MDCLGGQNLRFTPIEDKSKEVHIVLWCWNKLHSCIYLFIHIEFSDHLKFTTNEGKRKEIIFQFSKVKTQCFTLTVSVSKEKQVKVMGISMLATISNVAAMYYLHQMIEARRYLVMTWCNHINTHRQCSTARYHTSEGWFRAMVLII